MVYFLSVMEGREWEVEADEFELEPIFLSRSLSCPKLAQRFGSGSGSGETLFRWGWWEGAVRPLGLAIARWKTESRFRDGAPQALR